MQKLSTKAKADAKFFVESNVAVSAIERNGVADRGKVSTDLITAPGDNFGFNKSKKPPGKVRTIVYFVCAKTSAPPLREGTFLVIIPPCGTPFTIAQ